MFVKTTAANNPQPLTKQELSASQEFLCNFDRGDRHGVFGPRHLIVAGWRLRGPVQPETLEASLQDVLARHEALRTRIVRGPRPHALVYQPGPVNLQVHYLPPTPETTREHRAHEFLNDVEAGNLNPAKPPMLRAELGRFDSEDAVLALVTHHTVSDAWSMHVILRDVAICYAMRRGLEAPHLADRRPYSELAPSQRHTPDEDTEVALAYWRNHLIGAQFLTLPTDHRRNLESPPVYSVHRFSVNRHVIKTATSLASSMRCSPFMVLYACFNLFLHRRTGTTDITTPILTSGRTDASFEETVGPFFNFLPIRTNVAACRTFRDVLTKTRTALLDAYSYELPFRDIATQAPPQLMQNPIAATCGVTTGFEVFHNPQSFENHRIGDIRYTSLRRRLLSASNTSEIPDGNLWDFDLHTTEDTIGLVKYNSLDFDGSTIELMVEEYLWLLKGAMADPDALLPQ